MNRQLKLYRDILRTIRSSVPLGSVRTKLQSNARDIFVLFRTERNPKKIQNLLEDGEQAIVGLKVAGRIFFQRQLNRDSKQKLVRSVSSKTVTNQFRTIRTLGGYQTTRSVHQTARNSNNNSSSSSNNTNNNTSSSSSNNTNTSNNSSNTQTTTKKRKPTKNNPTTTSGNHLTSRIKHRHRHSNPPTGTADNSFRNNIKQPRMQAERPIIQTKKPIMQAEKTVPTAEPLITKDALVAPHPATTASSNGGGGGGGGGGSYLNTVWSNLKQGFSSFVGGAPSPTPVTTNNEEHEHEHEHEHAILPAIERETTMGDEAWRGEMSMMPSPCPATKLCLLCHTVVQNSDYQRHFESPHHQTHSRKLFNQFSIRLHGWSNKHFHNVTEEKIRDALSHFGKIRGVVLKTRYAYVNFERMTSLQACLETKSVKINGKKVKINESGPRVRHLRDLERLKNSQLPGHPYQIWLDKKRAVKHLEPLPPLPQQQQQQQPQQQQQQQQPQQQPQQQQQQQQHQHQHQQQQQQQQEQQQQSSSDTTTPLKHLLLGGQIDDLVNKRSEIYNSQSYLSHVKETLLILNREVELMFGKGSKVVPFGSYCTRLGDNVSDIDILIDTNSGVDSNGNKIPITVKQRLNMFHVLMGFLNDKTNVAGLRVQCFVSRARVPILQLYGRNNKLKFDLSIAIDQDALLGLYNTALINEYIAISPVVAKLAHTMRAWHSAHNTGVNGYSAALMVIFFCQQQGIVPNIQVRQTQEGSNPRLKRSFDETGATSSDEHRHDGDEHAHKLRKLNAATSVDDDKHCHDFTDASDFEHLHDANGDGDDGDNGDDVIDGDDGDDDSVRGVSDSFFRTDFPHCDSDVEIDCAKHVMDLFQYYSDFDWKTNAISIRLGRAVDKRDLLGCSLFEKRRYAGVVVEDPFQRERNVTVSIKLVPEFQMMLWDAARKLKASGNLTTILTPRGKGTRVISTPAELKGQRRSPQRLQKQQQQQQRRQLPQQQQHQLHQQQQQQLHYPEQEDRPHAASDGGSGSGSGSGIPSGSGSLGLPANPTLSFGHTTGLDSNADTWSRVSVLRSPFTTDAQCDAHIRQSLFKLCIPDSDINFPDPTRPSADDDDDGFVHRFYVRGIYPRAWRKSYHRRMMERVQQTKASTSTSTSTSTSSTSTSTSPTPLSLASVSPVNFNTKNEITQLPLSTHKPLFVVEVMRKPPPTSTSTSTSTSASGSTSTSALSSQTTFLAVGVDSVAVNGKSHTFLQQLLSTFGTLKAQYIKH